MRRFTLIFLVFVIAFMVFPRANSTAEAAPTLNWINCGSCPETPEVSVSGNTITLGTPNRTEQSSMNNSKNGVSALLPPASEYTITFDFSLYTWDSYNPLNYGWSGYWDSFSVSVSSSPYWQLSLSDPVTPSNLPGLAYIWGGTIYNDGKLESTSGQNYTKVIKGNPSGNNYLNVMLDTATYPESNHRYPSWGTITIKDVKVGSNNQTSQAVEYAKSVVGAKYTWGGKGWNYDSKLWADKELILTSGYRFYNPNLYNPVTKKDGAFDWGTGLDCSGLVFWSNNKASGIQNFSQGPISYEGADGQYRHCTTSITEAQLQPGDLLFFDKTQNGEMDHVAMYVGDHSGFDVVHATPPIAKWDKKDDLKKLSYFKGYGRLKACPKPLSIKTQSPIFLSVTDPDGFTIGPNTTISTNEEILREIPGVLYYSINENLDDEVYSPILKPGIYRVTALPKPDANPADTFSIIMEGDAKSIILAQDVPVNEIDSNGYWIMSTGDEIIPISPTNFYLPFIR